VELSNSSSPTPFNLYNHGSFVNNGRLYLFGGHDSTISGISPLTYIYEISTGNWSIGSNMTQAAYGFGYATDGNRFYAIGGYSSSNNGDTFIDYTQVFDISNGNWSINSGIVYSGGVSFNAATVLDDSLHSIGGSNANGYSISAHRIASLCGVYTFSGECDDENQCTFNETCQSNGACIGRNVSCPKSSNPCQNPICNCSVGMVCASVRISHASQINVKMPLVNRLLAV